MSAYSLLDALSFGISFVEIRQEIKLLEHFKMIKDHLYIYHFFRKFFKAFIPAHVFTHPLITKHEKKNSNEKQ
jgi:sulfur relay (sulfurtransferase) DsrC/TusE family protein